jgi:hypothetical protein
MCSNCMYIILSDILRLLNADRKVQSRCDSNETSIHTKMSGRWVSDWWTERVYERLRERESKELSEWESEGMCERARECVNERAQECMFEEEAGECVWMSGRASKGVSDWDSEGVCK